MRTVVVRWVWAMKSELLAALVCWWCLRACWKFTVVAERYQQVYMKAVYPDQVKKMKIIHWLWYLYHRLPIYLGISIYLLVYFAILYHTRALHFHLPPLSPHPGVFTSPLVTESIHTCHDIISYGLDVNVRRRVCLFGRMLMFSLTWARSGVRG